MFSWIRIYWREYPQLRPVFPLVIVLGFFAQMCNVLFGRRPSKKKRLEDQKRFMAAYNEYTESEHPMRAAAFSQVVGLLDVASRRIAVSPDQVRDYLGEPDSVRDLPSDLGSVTLQYRFKHPDQDVFLEASIRIRDEIVSGVSYGQSGNQNFQQEPAPPPGKSAAA
jgi:hypothetical protein